jgi:hypothetical protein
MNKFCQLTCISCISKIENNIYTIIEKAAHVAQWLERRAQGSALRQGFESHYENFIFHMCVPYDKIFLMVQ